VAAHFSLFCRFCPADWFKDAPSPGFTPGANIYRAYGCFERLEVSLNRSRNMDKCAGF